MSAALLGTGLAWASARGLLPRTFTNAPAYLSAAAAAEAALLAYGLSTFGVSLGRHAFGARQLGVAVLSVILGVGLGAQALEVTLAEWAVRPDGLPPAWPVVDSSQAGAFRILWLGRPAGVRFSAPGGDPIGLAEEGEASVRFGLTDRKGSSALDIGRGRTGRGYDELTRVLDELLVGDTQHAGALLGPMGIRFLVAEEGDLPSAVVERLDQQLDLDLVPAGGLTIYRNAAVLPIGMATTEPVPDAPDPTALQLAPYEDSIRLEREGAGWVGGLEARGTAVVSEQFDGGWRVSTDAHGLPAYPAFGWAIAGEGGPGQVVVSFTDQWVRTSEMWVLALLWLAALWITRKPGSA